jgi:hypothetical protein
MGENINSVCNQHFVKIMILYIFWQLYANGIIALWFTIDETAWEK